MEEQKLKMSFDPHTIEHLGVKMYSNIPNAIAELVANAYDAEAERVDIKLIDKDGNKSIHIIDDGVGMNFNEVNSKFLRIGRKKRLEDGNAMSPNGKRKVTGKKGLGKLAFFGIGETIDIITKKDGEKIEFTLDWNQIIKTDKPEYEPNFKTTECGEAEHGTTIILKHLKRKSSFDKEGLAVSLSRLFNLFDNTFRVYITLNQDEPLEVDDKLKYMGLNSQFKWLFPFYFKDVPLAYTEKNNIDGEIFSTEKPLKPGLRGITLYAKGRLVNMPEFFGVSESSHGYSYFTGWLNIDFVDDWERDVISTDRQSLNWDLPETEELRNFLKKLMWELERDWRKKRKVEKEKQITQTTRVNIPSWYEKLPENIHLTLEPIISAVMFDSELPADTQSKIVNGLHELIPEYPHFHWRHLHTIVQDASGADYKRKDYYRAFEETIKRYISEVRRKSECNNPTDSGMMGDVFGKGKKLKVAAKYKKTDGSDFTPSTIDNIEEGQKFLSMGILQGARNPVAHEEVAQLRDSKLFTEKDCLDALSLLSHLFRRLDDA